MRPGPRAPTCYTLEGLFRLLGACKCAKLRLWRWAEGGPLGLAWSSGPSLLSSREFVAYAGGWLTEQATG